MRRRNPQVTVERFDRLVACRPELADLLPAATVRANDLLVTLPRRPVRPRRIEQARVARCAAAAVALVASTVTVVVWGLLIAGVFAPAMAAVAVALTRPARRYDRDVVTPVSVAVAAGATVQELATLMVTATDRRLLAAASFDLAERT